MDDQLMIDELEKTIAHYSTIRTAVDEWLRGYGVKVEYIERNLWTISVDGKQDEYVWDTVSEAYRDAIVMASDIRVLAHLKDKAREVSAVCINTAIRQDAD